jgi:hypothetical protein
MKRSLAALPPVFLLVFLFLFSAAPARAATPATDARAFGIELCQQSVCGSAIFVGILRGEVAGVHTSFGTFSVAVTHEDLPTAEKPQSAITGGAFELRAGTQVVQGLVLGGTLTYLGGNYFGVQMVLMTGDGSLLAFQGTLSHNTFPPTITGRIFSVSAP